MKVLFDTNVILDLLLDREPFADDAARCFSRVEQGEIEGFLCATTLTTLHYLISKSIGAKSARESIELLLSLFQVALVDYAVLEGALALGFKDFEDAVLHEAARAAGVDLIVTRNIVDFKRSKIQVRLPADLVAMKGRE